MTRQYQVTRGGQRTPVTPDCGIEGCTRAEYRAGLCRKHHELRPLEARYAAAAANMMANHAAAKVHRDKTVAEVQAIVNEQAS